jgi:hypothetical protein
MARFDPNTYPDRLAFVANARRIRAEELEKLFDAAAVWFGARQHRFAGRVARIAAAAFAPSHQHSVR